MKKFTTILLSLVMCLCIIGTSMLSAFAYNVIPSTLPNTDTSYTYIDNITVQIPGTEYIVTLNKVSSVAGLYYDENNKPVYRFALMESESSIFWEQFTWSIHSSFSPYETNAITAVGDVGYRPGSIDVYRKDRAGYAVHGISVGEADSLEGGAINYDLKDSRALATLEILIGDGGWTYYDYTDTERTIPTNLIYAPSYYSKGSAPIVNMKNVDVTTFDITTLAIKKIEIKEPSQTEIRCKDGIILHANVNGTLPEGTKVVWSTNNNCFKTSQADDDSFQIVSNNNGYTTVTISIVDADGNILATDSIEMYSNAGFGQKIAGFFRSLFGLTKIYGD